MVEGSEKDLRNSQFFVLNVPRIGAHHSRCEEMFGLEVKVVRFACSENEHRNGHGHADSVSFDGIIESSCDIVRSASGETFLDMDAVGVLFFDMFEDPKSRCSALGEADYVDTVQRKTELQTVQNRQGMEVHIDAVGGSQFAVQIRMHAFPRNAETDVIGHDKHKIVLEMFLFAGSFVGRGFFVGGDGKMREEDDAFGLFVLRPGDHAGQGNRRARLINGRIE